MTVSDERPKSALAHYTRGEGLLGILSNQRIWATQIQYLNDSQEYLLAYEQAVESLWRVHVVKQVAATAPDLADAIKDSLISAMNEKGASLARVFVTSFSELSDDLSQWRAYSRVGDSYALLFDGPELAKLASSRGWTLVKCRYGNDEFPDIVGRVLWTFQSWKAGSFANLELAIESLSAELAPIAASLKHEAFRGEQEWRLISPRLSKRDVAKFRPGATTIVPYIEFDVKQSLSESLPLRAMTVGPGPTQELAQSALMALALQFGYGMGFQTSSAPFRVM